MKIDNEQSPWQRYSQLYLIQLSLLKQNQPQTQLETLSQQLTEARLALVEKPSQVLKFQDQLTPALARIELIYIWCIEKQWPTPITTLLLNASFCSSLNADMMAEHNKTTTKYPALACIKYQQQSLPKPIITLLSHCYANQRKLAYYKQNPLSALLTLAEQLTNFTSLTTPTVINLALLRQQIGLFILSSRCELELNLLAILANYLQPKAKEIIALAPLLSEHSITASLPLEEYSQLESYLSQYPVMASYIMRRASQLNRKKQPINQIKLAISLLGLNALPLLLATAEIKQQLADLMLPNHEVLDQFSRCFAVAIHLLLPGDLTKDKADLVSYCLCAPLWLNQQNYLQALVKVKPNSSAQLNLPFTTRLSETRYIDNLRTILPRYELEHWFLPTTELIYYLNRQPTQLTSNSLALLTAWQAAKILLTGITDKNLVSLQQLLNRFQQLTSANFCYQADELCQNIATYSNCYCPITLSL